LEAALPAALDALIVGLYVVIDDFLGPRRRGRGRPPKLSDAELITLGVAQMLLAMPNDRQFLALAGHRLRHLFPELVDQSGYNRRLRRLAPEIGRCISYLASISPSFGDRLRLLDSTPVPCGQSRETTRRSEFAGYAGYGYCRSHSRWFWGFRLYLICAGDGMPIGWELAAANIGERILAAEMLDRVPVAGHTVIADKNFSGAEFEDLMTRAGATFLRPDRKNEPRRHGSLGAVRQWIDRPFGPARANSGSNTTAPARSPAWEPASACACSHWPAASGTTTSPANHREPSPPTAADYASTI
jgi:hypothetical protein